MRRIATKKELQDQDYVTKAIKIMNKKHPSNDSADVQLVETEYTICPKCGGNLTMIKFNTNGHIWGFCSNPKGCLNWMM